MLKGIGEGATYFYHPDHLGSVSVVSNHQGVPYERLEYLPFGEVWIEDVDAATRYIPFRFTSKELDRETGLYYYGARYYEPKVSRWMSADPAGFALINPMEPDEKGGLQAKASYSVIEAVNWYSYTSNNPVRYVDPTGGQSVFFGIGLQGFLTRIDEYIDIFPIRDATAPPIRGSYQHATQLDWRVASLSFSQDEARNDPRWQPGQPNSYTTWCNQATFDIAEATGFNTEDLYEGGDRWDTLANEFIANIDANLDSGDTLLQEIGGEEAQMRADAGYTVIAAWENSGGHGHVATVRPGGEYSDALGPTVSNVGSDVGVGSVDRYFSVGEGGAPNLDDVRYFYQPSQFD